MIPKEKEEQFSLFATYTILYIHDTACNCIKELEPYIKDKDKETKKIYGALKKRANEHFDKVNNVVSTSINYLADFCSEMDDICYDSMLAYKNALYDTYKEKNLEDCEYYTQVETMRSMVEVANFSAKRILESLKQIIPNVVWLEYYTIPDLVKIANNFADWCYRKTPKDLQIDYVKSGVIEKLHKVSELMVEYKSFDKAYLKALEYERERKKN